MNMPRASSEGEIVPVPQVQQTRFKNPRAVLLANALMGNNTPEETIKRLEAGIVGANELGGRKGLHKLKGQSEQAWDFIEGGLVKLLQDPTANGSSETLIFLGEQGQFNPYNELLVARVYDSLGLPRPFRNITIAQNEVLSWQTYEGRVPTPYGFDLREIRRFAKQGPDDMFYDAPVIRLDALHP